MGSKVLFATGADVDLCDSFICRPGTRTGRLLSLANEQGSLSRKPLPLPPTPCREHWGSLWAANPVPEARRSHPCGGRDRHHPRSIPPYGVSTKWLCAPHRTYSATYRKRYKRNMGACALHPHYTAAFRRTVALASVFSGPMLWERNRTHSFIAAVK